MVQTNTQSLDLKFRLRKERAGKKTGTAPVECRLYLNGEQREINVKTKIRPEDWDDKQSTVHPTSPVYNEAVLEFSNLSKHLTACLTFLELENPGKQITADMLRERYYEATGQKKQVHLPKDTLLQMANLKIDDFTELVDKGVRSNHTLNQYKNTRLKLIEFLKYRDTKVVEPEYTRTTEEIAQYLIDNAHYDISVENVTRGFIHEFRQYLLAKRSSILGVAAASKQIKNTKTFINHAVDKEVVPYNPIERIKNPTGDKEVIPLDLDEVLRIMGKEGLIERLDNIRIAFLVQIFTGFAFQDIEALTPDHIVNYMGAQYLTKDRGKTNINECVPILEPIAAIIKNNTDYTKRTGKLFRIISNTKYNGYLKELGAVCNIQKVLKTHLGRHTFADIMLNMGVPLEVVSRMLGHKSIRSTQRYCKVSLERIRLAMEAIQPELANKFQYNNPSTYEPVTAIKTAQLRALVNFINSPLYLNAA